MEPYQRSPIQTHFSGCGRVVGSKRKQTRQRRLQREKFELTEVGQNFTKAACPTNKRCSLCPTAHCPSWLCPTLAEPRAARRAKLAQNSREILQQIRCHCGAQHLLSDSACDFGSKVAMCLRLAHPFLCAHQLVSHLTLICFCS